MFIDDEEDKARSARRQMFHWMRRATLAVAAITLMFAGLSAAAHAETQPAQQAPTEIAALVRPNDMSSGALLFPSREPGFFVEAPRLKTDVSIDVTGPVARVKVTQRFENPSKGWVEGTYVFPLPDDSAVDQLKMQIGDRFIEGKIKPREEARQIYEKAKQEGKKAALLEQQRPNIFTNQVANIGPGETVVVQIEYQQTVHQSGGQFSLRFPMVVAPRYNPQPIVQQVEFNNGSGFAVPQDPVPNRKKIEAPVLDPSENAKINPVSLTVDLKAGFPLGDVKSPFHEITVTEDGAAKRKITLKNDKVPADRDFELTWKAAPGSTPGAGLFKEMKDGKTYLLAFVTPPATQDASAPKPAREVVFVIDNSGSMSGPSIEQARQSLALAISRLGNEDRFNVIRFDDTMTDFFGGLVPATGDNREKAIAYVNGLEAQGGTEMLPALQDALRNQGAKDPDALRQVVFLTDGAIGNEAQLFSEISGNRGDARVFTVGIGSAPNSYFMTKAAEIGRGTFTHVGSEQQVAERMGELFKKLENPVMTDIRADFENATAQDITPDPIPDLYAGEPVTLTAEIDGTATGKLLIVGKTGAQPWRVEMDIANAADGQGISKLWARRKIDDIEARAYEAEDPQATDKAIETVAMAHHLVSRMTSLVAVDVTPSRPTDQPLASTEVPLNLPAGWDFDKVFGESIPAVLPAPGDDKAMLAPPSAQYRMMAQAAANNMAAAPTPAAASLIARGAAGIALPQTATMADQRIMLGILMMVFALMAAAGMALWRRSWKDFVRAEARRRGV
ncbi:marine proteobacterial sortase target protein [Agrobacterium sp. ES01]|uniref:marine proteobacterial sortase target protein n=1 Tax=Agrobacterium sp. ES01 TaxID=3420714 RepID=UPI003D0DFA45